MKVQTNWHCRVCGHKKGMTKNGIVNHSKCSAILRERHANKHKPGLPKNAKRKYDEATIDYFSDLNYNKAGHPDD